LKKQEEDWFKLKKYMTFSNKIKTILLSLFLFSITISATFCKDKIEENKVTKTNFTGPGKLVFNETSHDFGQLRAGEIVECTIILTNKGGKKIEITDIEADCGCTIPEMKNKTINSGESQKITVTFNTTGFTGNIFKTITIYSDSPEKETEIYLSALVINENIINNY
jgi:hypothetical protein